MQYLNLTVKLTDNRVALPTQNAVELLFNNMTDLYAYLEESIDSAAFYNALSSDEVIRRALDYIDLLHWEYTDAGIIEIILSKLSEVLDEANLHFEYSLNMSGFHSAS